MIYCEGCVRTMKKPLLVSILSLMMLLTIAAATAKGEMTNPCCDAAQPPARSDILTQSAALSLSVERLTEPSFDQDTQWRVSVEGAEGACNYVFYILNGDWETCGYFGPQTEPLFSYRFVVPGDYSFYVRATDSAGNTGSYVENFTLEDDGAHPTTESIVASLAAQCLAAGCTTDFEKALWMHDWLTMNASYDLSYSHYSADGVLVRGTGVCDSYRRAYAMLMNAVGVETISVTGGNHAWNQVKMDGEWYNVDVTWDDPIDASGTQQPAASGREHHLYFGLPDEIMRVDHTFETDSKQCTAYEMNYFLHTGKVSIWTEGYISEISSALDNGGFSISLDIPTYYMIENGRYSYGKEHIVYPLTAMALTQREWPLGDKRLHIDVSYDQAAKALSGEVFLDPYTLALPKNITRIEDEAFRGNTSFMAVDIPAGVSLGEGCFAGCTDLWKAVVSDGVTSIADAAFSGCELVTIVCGEGSYAHQYALENGLRVQLQ